MAQKIVTDLVDDYDGISVATETITFSLDGRSYEIDLSEANAARLRAMVAIWTPHARKAPAPKIRRRRRRQVPPLSRRALDVVR